MKVYGLVRLTKAPERFDNTVKLSIAWNDYRRESHFFNAVAFGKTGDAIYNVNKGDRIFIKDGVLTTNNYEKEGKRIYSSNIIINQFEYIESKRIDAPKQEERFTPPTIDVQESDLPF